MRDAATSLSRDIGRAAREARVPGATAAAGLFVYLRASMAAVDGMTTMTTTTTEPIGTLYACSDTRYLELAESGA